MVGLARMKGTEVAKTLKERFKEKISDVQLPRENTIILSLSREDLVPFCKFLRDELSCEHLSLISAVDWPENYECVYHVASYLEEFVVELHVKIPKDDPRIPSLCEIWRSADFPEREAYDMMGIIFKGHPDLRRILLPEDFKFYPLRKDFRG